MPSTHVHLVIVIDNATDQYALKAHFLQRSFLMLDIKKKKKLLQPDLPFCSEHLVIYLQKKIFNANKSFSYRLMVLHINMPLHASFLKLTFKKTGTNTLPFLPKPGFKLHPTSTPKQPFLCNSDLSLPPACPL